MLQPVRGMHDLMPETCARHAFVTKQARQTALLFGFEEVATPLLEFRETFDRTVTTSDLVLKEMFDVLPRGGKKETQMVLRPEGTAPLMRAVLSEGLTQRLPLRFFYTGPMFRYDRPQKGRLRQFHQVGVECIGIEKPWSDVEALSCAHDFLIKLRLQDQVLLEINTLGDGASRDCFREKLRDYLAPHRSALSEDSQVRLESNPLRILDSKSPRDQEILEGAPSLAQCLTPESRQYFEGVQEGLTALHIPYRLNPCLVRGLDYYVHTAFEFKTARLGAQGTVLGGGRYDGLSTLLGGPPLPGVGWAAGVERLALLIDHIPTQKLPVSLLPHSEEDLAGAMLLAQKLRQQGIAILMISSSQSLGKRLQKAQKTGQKHVFILGATERMEGTVVVKNLETGFQETVSQSKLATYLRD